MTLSGAWHKLRTDPILKFMIVAISFYMMSTFEGPMMSIKTVNALSHYSDWTIGHVHSGALGWVAMISIGAIYMLIPRTLGLKEMASVKMIDTHFWVHTIGVVLYAASMWVSGIGQGLMSRATNADGTLAYAWIEIVKFTYPYYLVRLGGGLLCLTGMGIMAVNVVRTFALAKAGAADADVPVPPAPGDNVRDGAHDGTRPLPAPAIA
jgi:cytochrome c oxidase cbb3-type subunit 1